jgi:hypothetical protein
MTGHHTLRFPHGNLKKPVAPHFLFLAVIQLEWRGIVSSITLITDGLASPV